MYVVTYWQVYLIAAAGALAAYWSGWGSCWLYQRHALAVALEPRGRHAAGQPPAPLPELPELPAAAETLIDARHANAMAAAAPREPSPLARGRAAVAAVTGALGWLSAARAAWDTGRPWGDDTGTFTALVAEQDRDQAAA